MAPSGILDLPAEIVLRILHHVSLHSLLSFSLASKTCHRLADSALATLAFGVFPNRLASHISELSTSTDLRDIISEAEQEQLEQLEQQEHERRRQFRRPQHRNRVAAEYRVSLIVPDEAMLDLPTLIAFHDALHTTVLQRYAVGLRVLELCVWRVERGMAEALASLQGLRSLTLKVDNPFSRKRVRLAGERLLTEERHVWGCTAGAFTCLEVLRLEGLSINAQELGGLISKSPTIEELWLTRCHALGTAVWRVLGQWGGAKQVSYLGVVECGAVRLEHLDILEHFKGLKVFSIEGAKLASPSKFEEMNRDVWQIPKFIVPSETFPDDGDEVTEVDPLYLSSSDNVAASSAVS